MKVTNYGLAEFHTPSCLAWDDSPCDCGLDKAVEYFANQMAIAERERLIGMVGGLRKTPFDSGYNPNYTEADLRSMSEQAHLWNAALEAILNELKNNA